ncbi:MAG: hypothetical protein ABJK37_09190 [Paraglaciecola sp.]|uniref:hypothetical protein n=1 Tax=Paraglaciecola sp. TaxID=1920173 RepID=UPI00329A4C75
MRKPNSQGMLANGRLAYKNERYVKALHAIFNHPDYIALSPTAKALLWDLSSQYNGRNNGDLTLAPKVMGKLGWTKPTILRHRQTLIDKNWIFIAGSKPVRNGHLYLYALTWLEVNDCNGKLFEDSVNRKPRSLKV